MSFDSNDPRLTAYALGESLEDSERAEAEAHLAEHAESRKYFEEVRELARVLTEQLHVETAPVLTPEQRRTIDLGVQTTTKPVGRISPWVIKFAAAACLLGLCVSLLLSAAQSSREASRRAQAQHDARVLNDQLALRTAPQTKEAIVEEYGGLRYQAPAAPSEPALAAASEAAPAPSPSPSKELKELESLGRGTSAPSSLASSATPPPVSRPKSSELSDLGATSLRARSANGPAPAKSPGNRLNKSLEVDRLDSFRVDALEAARKWLQLRLRHPAGRALARASTQ